MFFPDSSREAKVMQLDKLFDIMEVLENDEVELTNEGQIQRQFKRYGTKFARQFRCMSGPKEGRLVTSPEKCGIRKDPLRVRIGKKSARIKKQQRVRKTLFTKRKTISKILQRRNKLLRGENTNAV